MNRLTNDIKNLIDSLEYQIKRLEVIDILPDDFEEAQRTLASLKDLYNRYIVAKGPAKTQLEKELMMYIKTPVVMPRINRINRWIAAFALLGVISGSALFYNSCVSPYAATPDASTSDSVDEEKEFKITFFDGQDVLSYETFTPNNNISCPEPAQKEGYDFAGWFYEDGKMYHDGDNIDTDTVLQAKWISLKFSNLSEFKSYCENKFAELSSNSFFAMDGKVCVFNFFKASDYLEFIDVIKYNTDLLAKIDVDIHLTPEDVLNIPKFPAEKINYRITLAGDFTALSLKNALINLNLSNVSLKDAQISEEDLAYFLKRPNIYLSITNSSFDHWSKLDYLCDSNNPPEHLKVTINDDIGQNFIFLTAKTLEIVIPADKKQASVICNSDNTIINLEIENSSNLNNMYLINTDSGKITVNVTLKEGYKGDIKSDIDFIKFLGGFIYPHPIEIKIENTGEIISVIVDENGCTIIDSNFKNENPLNDNENTITR